MTTLTGVRVWDPLVRVFHWALAGTFLANALVVDPEADLHQWLGYIVLGLVLARILWGFVGTRHARFSSFPPSVSGAVDHLKDIASGRPDRHLSHNPLGALMVYNMLASLVLLALSGIALEYGPALAEEDWLEEVHEALANWMLVSVGLHIAGVLYEQHRSRTGLVRAMITGRKTLPEGDRK